MHRQLDNAPEDAAHLGESTTFVQASPIARRNFLGLTWTGTAACWLGIGLATSSVGRIGDSKAQSAHPGAPTMNDYEALRAYTGQTTDVRITAPGLAGTFRFDPLDNSSIDNGGSIIVDTNGRRWKRLFVGASNLMWWGAKGNSTADDSAALQLAIDASRGSELRIPDGRFLHAGVALIGSSYNGTVIRCEGELLLKARPNSSASNFQGHWAGLILKDVSGVTVSYRGDGNRSAQPIEEHCHLVCIAGGSRLNFPSFLGREVRGDGIYIGQSDYHRSSEVPSDLAFGQFSVLNTADDGRNAMSIISAKRISIRSFTSVRVGGILGSATQPGGLDIEPNQEFQTVDTVRIGTAAIDTAGNFGFQVLGKASGTLGGNINDVVIEKLDVTSRCPSDSATPISFRHCSNIAFNGSARFAREARPAHVGLLLDNVKGAKIQVTTIGGALGVRAGYAYQVVDLTLDADCRNYSVAGAQTVYITRSKITIRASGGRTGSYALFTRALRRPNISQSDVDYTIQAPRSKMAGATIGVYNELSDPISFNNVRFVGGSLSGYAANSDAIRGFNAGVQKLNVEGMLPTSSAPISGPSANISSPGDREKR